jgi:predicted kinase
MRAKPVLILMCGLPFAGKTTVARNISAQCNWRYISVDGINTERGAGSNENAILPDEWRRTYAEGHRRVRELLSAGQSVILDDTNFLRSHRDELRQIASVCRAETYVLYVPTLEAEVRRRRQENRITNQRGDVRDEDFAFVIRHFQPPTTDERAIRYDPTVAISTLIKQMFSDQLQAQDRL